MMKLSSFTVGDLDISAVLFCIIAALLTAYYVAFISRKFELPPGPMAIPVLGNLVQMVKDPHLVFSKWARQYGKMYTIYMGNRAALVVNDSKWLKELFGTMASTGKYRMDTVLLISQGPNGIGNTEGTVWEEQRTFCARALKQLGYGQGRSMEPMILDEVHEVCDWIREASNSDSSGIVDLHNILRQSTINTLWTLVTGEKFKLRDMKSENMWSYWVKSMQYTVKTGLGFFPWMKYVAPKLSGYEDLDRACRNIHDYIGGIFEEHKRSYVDGKTRDLIDMYIEHLKQINQNGDVESSYHGSKGLVNSVSSVVEIFVAGGETMSATLKWASIYLSHHQDCQQKLHQEIDEAIGRDRDPSLLDITSMPYAEAVILETLRMSSIVMFGIPHELLEDIPFQGYTLPKGLILMANLYHIHHDPEIWGDPDSFRPDRFLAEEGQGLREHMVPFQAGKRQCLGEQMARDVLFLFLVKLFQQFNFRLDSSVSKVEYFKPDVGILLLPKFSRFVISPR